MLVHPIIFTSSATRIIPIIKVVGEACNLKCSYCYYNHVNQTQEGHKTMSLTTLENFTKQYLSIFDGSIVFVWHGGEPLLAGINFYEQVIKIQNKYKRSTHKISNAIQTNGTLINEAWCEFFKEHKFQVSISLDGYPEQHDKYRISALGWGSSSKVIMAIQLLKRYGITPRILQTITKSSIMHLRKIFYYFTDELGIHDWGINVFRDIEQSNPLMRDESIDNEDYYTIIKTLFDLWIERNNPNLKIREIEDYALAALGKTPDTCSLSGNCSSFMTINWDGTVYPCCDNLVSKLPNLNYNLNDCNIIDILNSSERLSFARRINNLPPHCTKCEWLYGCYNGCTYHRENGLNPYCDAHIRLIHYFKTKLSI